MSFTAGLKGESVTRQVIEKIKQALLAGDLVPGSKLPTESQLCDMWGVSRTPIREAIKVLEFIGIIEIRRSEGTFVCSDIKPAVLNPLLFRLLFLKESSREMLEFRFAVEAMVFRMAIEKGAGTDHLAIRENINRMEAAAVDPKTAEELLYLDQEFHSLLAQATGNPMIQELSKELHQLFEHAMKKSLVANHGALALEHHRSMLSALEDHDLARGERVLQESLEAWQSFLE